VGTFDGWMAHLNFCQVEPAGCPISPVVGEVGLVGVNLDADPGPPGKIYRPKIRSSRADWSEPVPAKASAS
jgi:hypothetical protein